MKDTQDPEINEQRIEPIIEQKGISAWLRKLADESWQAELIMSGLAIVGSLSLPGMINTLANWAFITFAEDKYFLLGMIIIYLFIMAGGLIAFSLIHFFIRVLWIGMLGLSSVYPEGIKPIKTYSDHFNEKLIKHFPDIEGYSHKLDQMASLIFSLASAMVIVMLSSTFLISSLMLLASLIHMLVPALPFIGTFLVLLGLVIIPAMAGSVLQLKGLRDKPWVVKNHFKIFMVSLKGIYTIFYMPFSYIVYTLLSNSKKQSNPVAIIVFSLSLGLCAAAATALTNVKYFINENAFMRHAKPEYGMQAGFYEDKREEGELIYYGSLESDILKGKFIKAFIPIMGKEEEVRERICGSFDDIETDSTKDSRISRQEFDNACLEKYITVYINQEPIKNHSMIKYEHPETGQFGVNIYVPCETCLIGKNEIRVSRPYPVGANKPYDVYLPFFYEGEK